MSRKLRSFAAMLLALLPVAGARGQGFIVDHRPQIPIARAFEVHEVNVDARVRDQAAEVQVSQTFHNPGSTQIEAEYLFPVPEGGAVQNFVLLVDGKELPGRLLTKEEARRIYEDIVRSKRDPALLEYMGEGLIKTSVFPIPAGAERKVTMRYTTLLKRDRDTVEFRYPFATQRFTAKPIRKLELTVRLETREPLKSIYGVSHDAEVKRLDEHSAVIKLVQREVIPVADFRMVYTMSDGPIGASVLSYRPSASEDGYFLLLASPSLKKPDEAPRPKTVVFVLDRSGSMSGKKIEQARNALKFVLENLREGDLFNIVTYDDRVETFKPELQRYSPETRSDAARFVENIQPGGSTNIDDALRQSLDIVKDESRPSYILFLTDGLPTAGDTKETFIAEHVRERNKTHARLFAFGVGNDVNARLLDRLSGGNSGTSEYVKPEEDIEAHVSRFFSKLTSPVLASIRVEARGTDLNRTYPRDIPDLFEGGQLVLSGRYRTSGRTTFTVSGKVGDDSQKIEAQVELADAGMGSNNEFVARLWAVRRVGFIIDQIDLHGQNKELTDELVELSKKYGILTPYTSFLADERVELHAATDNFREAGRRLAQLDQLDGAAGVGQRYAKGTYQLADRAEGLNSLSEPQAGGYGGGGAALGRGERAPRAALGGMMGGLAGRPAGGAIVSGPGNAVLAKDFEGRDEVVATVRNVGTKTFYRRAKGWVDADLSADDEAKAKPIEQFSDAYFKLAREQKSEENRYLTFDEPVTVKLADGVYRIEPAKK